ncbi:phage tail tape measure protein [Pectobacteriaceae bacterium CE90]|nr:phage tail tape measure protein [Pectobacteriaceae bacterium CE90]
MADSFQLKAIITAVDKLTSPLNRMSGRVKSFQQEFSNTMAKAAGLGVALGTGFIYPINQAIEFESSMADVKKVVNFDTPDQFKQMGEDIMKLSERLPMAANDMAKIASAGGQAGIASKDLMQFTESAVKMGVAFDQTAEESGQMMAQWRTAFKMTQKEVVTLADKINYLSNNGPANAQKISEIVTRIGPLGGVAGVASGEIAAMGATIAGMGVESEIAATGIKNFMLAVTKGGRATASQKAALGLLKINPKQLAASMQKDAKGTIVKLLESISKLPKVKQTPVLSALFGAESISAIAPLLTNLDLLKTNFKRVADAQQYAGSMQKEYESRAATTENSLKQLRNTFNVTGITIGSVFLPAISEGAKKLLPFIDKFRTWAKENPETIKGIMKFAGALVVVGGGAMIVTRAFRLMESVMKMSTAGKLVTLLVAGGWMIAENWETVGPIVKKVWDKINGVTDAIGGVENILTSVAVFTAGKWLVDMISGIGGAGAAARGLAGSLKSIAAMGVITVTIAVLFDIMKQLDKLHKDAEKQNTDIGSMLVNQVDKKDAARGYNGFVPRLKELLGLNNDNTEHAKMLTVLGNKQNGELKITFENAPTGMQVVPAGGQSLPWLQTDVGYSRYSGVNNILYK